MKQACRFVVHLVVHLVVLTVLGVGVPRTAVAASREPLRARHGVVVTSSPLASQVGLHILKEGGNAVDAAVAVGFALAVTHPSAGNLGGGGFLVYHDARSGRSTTVDYREKAPGLATRDLYLDDHGEVIAGLATDTHRSVAVPGTVAGLLYALEKYGSMERKAVLKPAISLAEKGFPVSFHLARSLRRSEGRLSRWPASRRIFLRDGDFYDEGELLVQEDLAATLRRIAEDGAAGFYEGRTARLLVQEMNRGKGLITAADLRAYRAVEREPVVGRYEGYTVVSMPPPSSGGTLLIEMLNMLEPVDLAALSHQSSAYVHLLAEVMKRAFADRARFLGDPDFTPLPVAGLTSKSYSAQRRRDFDPRRTTDARTLGGGDPWTFESEETTHFSIVDDEGSAVANTYTLNFGYGSGITVEGAGFLLNNIMDNFASKEGVPNGYGLIQGEANLIAPGKRPLSSMTPTLVLQDGKVRLVVGTPGGPTIINTVLQVILNVLDHGMSVQEAVDAPRVHHQWLPDRIDHEPGALVVDVLEALRTRGHELRERNFMGDAHVIAIDPETGLRLGAADPRRGGAAVGY